MASPLDRPLTWLFWIATVCFNGVVIAGAPNSWIEIIIVGQALVIASLASVGRIHRLAAAALVLMSIPLLTAIVELGDDSSNDAVAEWRWILAAIALLSITCVVAARTWRLMLQPLSGIRIQRERFRFPLIELFGWTIVVAIASLLLREAIFREALTVAIVPWLITSAVAALMAVLFLAPERPSTFVAVVLSLAAVLTDLGLKDKVWGDDQSTAAGIYFFVVVWILMTRLDDGIAARSGHSTKEESEGSRSNSSFGLHLQ